MKKTNSKFQINLPTELLEKSLAKATALGFSSVQDLVRVFLVNMNTQDMTLSFSNKTEYISEEYEKYLNKRLKETIAAINNRQEFTAKDADELIDQLESND